jgi:N-methylhydantoinase A/oxoprolinase/acetone carboxylase beta subunit
VRATLADDATDRLRSWIADRGRQPAEFTLFVLSGNSGLHACVLAERLGIRSLVAFAYSSVFAAFGANTTDVEHRYGRSESAPPGSRTRHDLDSELAALLAQARRDMAGEGFDLAGVGAVVEVEVGTNGSSRRHALGAGDLAGADSAGLASAVDSVWTASTGDLRAIELLVRAPLSHWEPSRGVATVPDAVAPVATRAVRWDGAGLLDTAWYDESALRTPAPIPGPAVIETPITNYAVAPGWSATVDDWGNLVVTQDP